MNDKAPTTETAQNVTELPEPRRPFAWKKYAKYAGYGTAAVLSAIVIFKLASSDAEPEQVDYDEPTSDVDTSAVA